MRRELYLGDLVEKVARRAYLLRELVRGRTLPIGSDDERAFSYTAIEGLNLWILFARSYYLSTALQARLPGGARITLGVKGIRTEKDALTRAIRLENPAVLTRSSPWSGRDEPDWHVPAVFGRVLADLIPSNLALARAGLSYHTTVFNDLPVFRNYYAHKGGETAGRARRMARRYLISPKLRPTEILATRLPARPQCLMADWLDDVRNVVMLMV